MISLKKNKRILFMEQKELSLLYLNRAIKYLHLAENVFDEMKKQGNNWFITSNKPIQDNDYNNLTKWSDFNIIFPSLFIFYHGIELSIKGLLVLTNQNISKIHKFSILFNELKKQESIYSDTLNVIEKYISPSLIMKTSLGNWMKINNINMDNLHEILRYPTWGNGDISSTNDSALKYKGEEILPFINEISIDIDKLRKLIVKQYRENK
jgi:hypothetical protein